MDSHRGMRAIREEVAALQKRTGLLLFMHAKRSGLHYIMDENDPDRKAAFAISPANPEVATVIADSLEGVHAAVGFPDRAEMDYYFTLLRVLNTDDPVMSVSCDFCSLCNGMLAYVTDKVRNMSPEAAEKAMKGFQPAFTLYSYIVDTAFPIFAEAGHPIEESRIVEIGKMENDLEKFAAALEEVEIRFCPFVLAEREYYRNGHDRFVGRGESQSLVWEVGRILADYKVKDCVYCAPIVNERLKRLEDLSRKSAFYSLREKMILLGEAKRQG
mmetsp:Transcript_19389/g.54445  ORF Transcript_19389/g.54445 Transcript_19389/m.54445 type:complete len:272 (+) Transcript_19389:91-906(+)